MSRISGIIPSLRFTIRMNHPNPTKYCLQNHNSVPRAGHKNAQLFTRKMSKQFDRPDVFTPEKAEETVQTVNTTVVENTVKVKSPKVRHQKSGKEALARYFDNDNPRKDYLESIGMVDDVVATETHNQKLREVKNADEIRKFVESKRGKDDYSRAHGYDDKEMLEDLATKISERNKNIESKYSDKTKKYFDEIKEENDYRRMIVEQEEAEEAARLKQEKLDSIIEPYINNFNPRAHKIQVPRYPYDRQGYKDNHNKVQRSNKSVKLY